MAMRRGFMKGEYRPDAAAIDAIRLWAGATDYRHNELGLADPADPFSDGVRQTFTNKEQEARVEVQMMPFNARFAQVTTAFGMALSIIPAGRETAVRGDRFGRRHRRVLRRECFRKGREQIIHVGVHRGQRWRKVSSLASGWNLCRWARILCRWDEDGNETTARVVVPFKVTPG